jgi:nucleoside permease NupC
MTALQLQSGFGLLALCASAWALGGCRRVSWRVVLAGLGLQLLLAALLLHVPALRAIFAVFGDAVNALATATNLTYALCGFTSFASLGIMLGGMVAMCPERRADIVRLGLPSLVSGTIACCMTGAVVGLLTAA